MPFTRPTVDDIDRYARELDLGYDRAMLERMHGVFGNLAGGYEALDALAQRTPVVNYRPRRHWRPEPADNPLGGWAVRTSIQGAAEGPLLGKTAAVKDMIFVADVPAAGGTDFLDGFVPEFDATVVARLLDAGAEIAGKSACEYFCTTGGSSTSVSGLVRNPHNPDFCAGGSSSGSAALVAAGAVDLALGTDGGGSVRIPSSLCGTVGMKATSGLVPFTGILRMEYTIDYVGPITRTVADNAAVLEIIAGADGYPWPSGAPAQRYTNALGTSVRGLRIAVLEQGFGQHGSEPEVDSCVRLAAQEFTRLGAEVCAISLPEHLDAFTVWAGVIGDGLWHMLEHDGTCFELAEPSSPTLADHFARWRPGLKRAPANLQLFALMGKHLAQYRGRYYAKAHRLIPWLRECYARVFHEVDVLLLPTTRTRARRLPPSQAALGFEQIMADTFDFAGNTAQFNCTGHPAISIPCGLRGGLPVGLQLVGRHYEESTLYRAAHAFEQAADWRAR
jgi:amidase